MATEDEINGLVETINNMSKKEFVNLSIKLYEKSHKVLTDPKHLSIEQRLERIEYFLQPTIDYHSDIEHFTTERLTELEDQLRRDLS